MCIRDRVRARVPMLITSQHLILRVLVLSSLWKMCIRDSFDTTLFKTKFACEVKGLNINDWIDRKEARKLDRYPQLAMIAAMQGVKEMCIRDRAM